MQLAAILKDTRTLQAHLLTLTEKQLTAMLDMELDRRPPRKLVLERVHQRLCILRAKRERNDIMRGL